jgi:GNAT superfamily N-acetyltransferase
LQWTTATPDVKECVSFDGRVRAWNTSLVAASQENDAFGTDRLGKGSSAGVEVRRLVPKERSAAVATLARAFHQDPHFGFLIPDLVSQAHAALTFMQSIMADALPFKEVWVAGVDDTVAGAAIWLPPTAYPRGWRRESASVARDMRAVPRLGRRLGAGVRMYGAMDRAHKAVTEPHWYLAVLGCDPVWQRRGVGTALITPVLRRADCDGVGTYLETQREDNLAWYARFGFDVIEELAPRGCPHMWTMRRTPT